MFNRRIGHARRLGKNALNMSTRQGDDIFQQDLAKQNRERMDTEVITPRERWMKPLIAFVFGFIAAFFFIALFRSSFVHSMQNSINNTELLENMFGKQHVYSQHDLFWSTFSNKLCWVLALVLGGAAYVADGLVQRRQNLMRDHSDINSYVDDKHVLDLQELLLKFDIFPDAGARSRNVSPTSIVSHVSFKNSSKIPDVTVYERDDSGAIILDENGKPKSKTLPFFDEEIAHKSFDAVGAVGSKNHYLFDPFKLKYRHLPPETMPIYRECDGFIDWLKKSFKVFVHNLKDNHYETVGDHILKDWYIPADEPERPTGAFIVETAPVNTFVIAITRGNKGQLWVNNTIDAWSREADPQNIFQNDPKGEVYSAFHDLLEIRGMEPVVFNLMDPVKSDQFNLLAPTIQAARKGDMATMQQSLLSLMNSFFPIDKKSEPFWTQSEQTLVRMMIYGMIDYYVEDERQYIDEHQDDDQVKVNRVIDGMWGRVTMYNLYEMLTELSRDNVKVNFKYIKNPDDDEWHSSKYLSDEDPTKIDENKIHDDAEETTKLMAFFNSMDILPRNALRDTALQEQGAMKMMEGTEKTRATIYGMTLVAMLFFTENPIARLTSASPSQSFDPASLAFPRRLRIKFDMQYLRYYKIDQQPVHFSAYHDAAFTQPYEGKDFTHDTHIDELGWCEFVFKGIFGDIITDDVTGIKRMKPVYIKMEVADLDSMSLMQTYYFEFIRGYAKSSDGLNFIINPRTNQRVVKDGTLRVGRLEKTSVALRDEKGEIVRDEKGRPVSAVKFKRGLKPEWLGTPHGKNSPYVHSIVQTEVFYTTRAKAVFAITPPHLSSYIKIVLLLVSVIFSENVSRSYMTKESGKPFYKTRNMLDELGNLSVEGHGIEDFQTKLSIGLGQGQEFTMILQTIQQLKDVYGDSVDKIVSGNTGVLVYLLSNETEMLQDLSKKAGNTHVSRGSDKSLQKSQGSLLREVHDDVTYSFRTQEEPLFSVDKLSNFTNGEALVINSHRKNNSGEAARPNPIYDSRETLMPMAWQLHIHGSNSKKFKHALANVRTTSSTRGLDIANNIPDFEKMYNKRLQQAKLTHSVTRMYMDENNITDETDLLRLDKNELAETLMRRINHLINATAQQKQEVLKDDDVHDMDDFADMEDADEESSQPITQQDADNDKKIAKYVQDIRNGMAELGDVPDQYVASVKASLDNGGVETSSHNDFTKDPKVLQAMQEHERNHTEKRFGNKMFSVDDMEAPIFKDAVKATLDQVGFGSGVDPVNGFILKSVSDKSGGTSGFELYNGDERIADAQVDLQQNNMNWEVSNEFYTELRSDPAAPIWRLTPDFSTILHGEYERLYKESDSTLRHNMS